MAVHGGLIQPSDAPPTSRSEALFARAKTLMPGGVSSPVRAFRSVGGTPRFISRAQGPYLWDADGHRYVDFVLSWGPMILGHAHPEVVEAVRKQVVDGMSFGAPCALEADLAERIVRMVPSMEMVRFVSSGAPGACRDRPREAPQVLRLLSRARRCVPGAGRLRRRDARSP
jgi:glutamate-1-semialdehyde 2,1-aminomutase